MPDQSDCSESNSGIVLVPYDEAYGDGFEELGIRRPDTAALRNLTGWQPRRTVDDAIDDVIEHERSRERRESQTVTDAAAAHVA